MSEENKTDRQSIKSQSSYEEESRLRRKRLRRKTTISYVVGLGMAFGGLFLVMMLAIAVYSWIDGKTGETDALLQQTLGNAQAAGLYTQEELDRQVAEAVARARQKTRRPWRLLQTTGRRRFWGRSGYSWRTASPRWRRCALCIPMMWCWSAAASTILCPSAGTWRSTVICRRICRCWRMAASSIWRTVR